jgi:hypothetical protein
LAGDTKSITASANSAKLSLLAFSSRDELRAASFASAWGSGLRVGLVEMLALTVAAAGHASLGR